MGSNKDNGGNGGHMQQSIKRSSGRINSLSAKSVLAGEKLVATYSIST